MRGKYILFHKKIASNNNNAYYRVVSEFSKISCAKSFLRKTGHRADSINISFVPRFPETDHQSAGQPHN